MKEVIEELNQLMEQSDKQQHRSRAVEIVTQMLLLTHKGDNSAKEWLPKCLETIPKTRAEELFITFTVATVAMANKMEKLHRESVMN